MGAFVKRMATAAVVVGGVVLVAGEVAKRVKAVPQSAGSKQDAVPATVVNPGSVHEVLSAPGGPWGMIQQ